MVSIMPSYVVWVVWAILIIGAIAQSRLSSRNMEWFNVVRVEPLRNPESLPRICWPEIIEPATECGCWGFSRFYLRHEQWAGLEELCWRLLGGPLVTGRASCAATNFTTNADGNIRLRSMATYFRRANHSCATEYFDPILAPSAPPSGRYVMEQGPTPLARYVSSNGKVTVRLKYKVLHKALGRFCTVMAHVMGTSKKEAFKKCCPRG